MADPNSRFTAPRQAASRRSSALDQLAEAAEAEPGLLAALHAMAARGMSSGTISAPAGRTPASAAPPLQAIAKNVPVPVGRPKRAAAVDSQLTWQRLADDNALGDTSQLDDALFQQGDDEGEDPDEDGQVEDIDEDGLAVQMQRLVHDKAAAALPVFEEAF